MRTSQRSASNSAVRRLEVATFADSDQEPSEAEVQRELGRPICTVSAYTMFNASWAFRASA